MPLPPPSPDTYSDNDCAICHDPLLLPSNNDPKTPGYFIDDVQLACNHHFHESCITEYAASSPHARSRCALCRAPVLDRSGNFIVTIRNENGHTGGIDLGREIDEQAYLRANPDVERTEVFSSLMAQMEFEDAEMMLKGEDQPDKGLLSPDVVYEQGRMTAMHMAAMNDDADGVRLLMRYGADKGLKDEEGKTAGEWAREMEARAVIAILF